MSLIQRLQKSKPVMLTPLGASLTNDEIRLYATHTPFGFCLFKKNCDNPTQMRDLCAQLREAAGHDCVISIDQEGGRVARMRAPHWPEFKAPSLMDDVYATYFDIGQMLKAEGVSMDFAPCLDVVPKGGVCDAIGDRCFSPDPLICGKKGIEACQGLLDAGISPVIKHMPGHGRAQEDSHFFLPVVKGDEDNLFKDLKAFQMVAQSTAIDHDHLCGMTAHVIYECWDKDNPATLSPTIIKTIIRDRIGFTGLLFSDDLAMKALDRYGSMTDRVQLCLRAGCDIALPCHSSFEQSKEILESL